MKEKAQIKTKDADDACVEYGARLSLKALVLLLVSSAVFGSSYCFHNPAALKNQLQEHFLGAMEKDEFEVLFVRCRTYRGFLSDRAVLICCL